MKNRGPRVDALVVDDEPYMAELVAEFAGERFGLSVRVETNAAAAVAAARELGALSNPLVCISDYSLKHELTGLDVVRAVREARPDAACAILSGYGREEIRSRVAGVALDALLEKPDDFETLVPEFEALVQTACSRNKPVPED